MKTVSLRSIPRKVAFAGLLLSAATLINAGDSKAAPVFCYLSQLSTCTYSVGTYTVNNFTIAPTTGWAGPVPPLPADLISIDFIGGSLQVNTSFIPNKPFTSGATLTYDVATTGLPFLQASSTSSVAGIPPLAFGSTNVTSTISGLASTLVSANSSVDSDLFTVPVLSTSVSSVFSTTGNGNFGNFVVSLSPGAPVSNVPGPLPILGAGAAFGFSRRLRRRINTSATA